MKTDRELLELAAKAYWAGEIDDVMSFHWDGQEAAIVYTHADNQDHNGNDVELLWNPLTDDGDALRLAVKLRLECMYEATELGRCHCQFWIASEGFKQVAEQLNDDPYAATRRAITRAAAAIGEEMK